VGISGTFVLNAFAFFCTLPQRAMKFVGAANFGEDLRPLPI
jgi:hypothetical protein